jgi:hypothetical protein
MRHVLPYLLPFLFYLPICTRLSLAVIYTPFLPFGPGDANMTHTAGLYEFNVQHGWIMSMRKADIATLVTISLSLLRCNASINLVFSFAI